MAEDQGQVGAAVEIRREIEQTRAELGETVQALAAKTDVKARAHEKVDEVKSNARSNPAPFVAAGVAVGVLMIWMLTRRSD